MNAGFICMHQYNIHVQAHNMHSNSTQILHVQPHKSLTILVNFIIYMYVGVCVDICVFIFIYIITYKLHSPKTMKYTINCSLEIYIDINEYNIIDTKLNTVRLDKFVYSSFLLSCIIYICIFIKPVLFQLPSSHVIYKFP